MDAPQQRGRICDELETLAKPPLRVVVVRKGMRHAGVPLHRDLVSGLPQQLAVVLPLVPLQVELCRDDVSRWQVFEVGRQNRRKNPVLEASFLLI